MDTITLRILIDKLNSIAKESPDTLDKPVEIHFDTGCYMEAMSVRIREDNIVVISEDP